ncbi:MAG: hypothetical protein RIS64_4297, partial [Bacteroidota bacterium]
MNQWIKCKKGYLLLSVCLYLNCQQATHSQFSTQKGVPCDTTSAIAAYKKGKYAFNALKDNVQALTFFKKALVIRQNCVPMDTLELFRMYFNVGNTHFEMGNYMEAVKHFEVAKHWIETLSKPSFQALNQAQLGAALGFWGENDRALNALTLAKQQYQILNDTLKQAEIAKQMGMCYYRKSNMELAINQTVEAIFVYEQQHSDSDLGDCFNNLSICYQKKNQPEDAAQALEKALAFYQKAYQQAPNPNILSRIGNVHTAFGHLHLKQKHLNQAFIDYQKALTIIKQNQQSISITYQVEAQNGIAAVYEQQQQYQKALAWCDTSLTQLPDWTQAIATLELKARLLNKMNQIELAYKTYCLLDSVLQSTYQFYKDDGSIYDLAEKAMPIYEKALKISLLRFQQTNNQQTMKKLFITLLNLFLLSPLIFAQTQTFPKNGVQDERLDLYAFTNATIITDANTSIEGATLIIKGSVIEAIGKGIAIPQG